MSRTLPRPSVVARHHDDHDQEDTVTTTDKRPPLHLGCGHRHTPFTPCPEPEADADQEVTDHNR